MTSKTKRDLPKMESLNRISKIPVVETGMQYAKIVYGKIKNSNALVQWSLGTVEGSIQRAIDRSLIAVPMIEMPLSIVDTIVCRSLDTIEQRVPAINYPPEVLLNKTKDLVSTKIVQPVIKRADSVKQFSVQGASKYGEIAASRLDTALDVADLYVDKYLPDASDETDSKVDNRTNESKTIQTIEHVNRFSRKLQRRLTKRTIAEARALRRQGINTAQILLHLMDLAIKDPKQFIETMKTLWINLSKDEPENQVPPANLEQLITMLTRESARRLVHLTNFTISTAANLPSIVMQGLTILNLYAVHLLDKITKTVNLGQAKTIAVARAKSEIEVLYDILMQLYSLVPQLTENLATRVKPTSSRPAETEASPTTSKEQKKTPNSEDNTCKDNSTKAQEGASTAPNKKEMKRDKKKNRNLEENQRSTGDENSNSSIENGSATSQKI
ncbi:lipid storage droplets surface-binding protein 1-like isoform X2 [Rhodnius prolixus]|uniref:Putative lipid storage droplet-1 n=2 Tax=Rhodnius prolixus TaxID=13249 RepID=R4G3X2_RHOPR